MIGKLKGVIDSYGEDCIILDVNGTRHELPYADLGPGRVQVEFGRLDELADDPELEEDEE